MAHTALREIVERAVEEARKLPGLGGSGVSGNAPEARNVAEDSYEDILATAILNKVTNIHFTESDLSRGHSLEVFGLRSWNSWYSLVDRAREDKSMSERWIF